LALLPACGGLPLDYPRTVSYAFDQPEQTSVGRLFGAAAEAHPGLSGVYPVRYGQDAFNGRMAMADLAERSLDLQYYIWSGDTTGRMLVERLLAAADRGVRVRVLLDDIGVGDRGARISALGGHPNVEVRSFNPFAARGKLLDMVLDAGRVNHRMHNKLMVMDGALAMVGGRNIGDHYFGVDTGSNFRDLDLIAAGPAVREMSALFDEFWNDLHSIPFDAFVREPATPDAARAALHEELVDVDYPYELEHDLAKIMNHLEGVRDRLIWAPVEVLHDDPSKVIDADAKIVRRLREVISGAEQELHLEVSYFVPTERGVETMRELVERGVEVRVLTNSLVTNDVLAAHSGYANYREEMLEAGVDLYELRPDPDVMHRWSRLSAESRASLHTKALVVDERLVFIGSFNMDPRSAHINMEVGLLVDSPELGALVAAHLDEGVLPDNAFRLLLDTDGDVVWLSVVGGRLLAFNKDPHSGWWQRFNAWFLGILPIEDQL